MSVHAPTRSARSKVSDASMPDGSRTLYRATCACGWRSRWPSPSERTALLDYERHARGERPMTDTEHDDVESYLFGSPVPEAVVDAANSLLRDGYAVVDDATLDALAARVEIEPTGETR